MAISPSYSDPAFLESNAVPAQPALLISAALHLMTQYTVNNRENHPCIKLAAVIERHLRALADRSDLDPVLRATCQQLSEQWTETIAHALPPPKRPSLFMQLILGGQSD